MTGDVLVIARHDDPHVPLVEAAVAGLGLSCGALPLGLPQDRYRVSGDLTGITWHVDGVAVEHDAFRRLLYLPFAVNRPAPVDCGGDAFAAREWGSLLESGLADWHRKRQGDWLIRPGAEILQDRKVALLSAVAGAGFAVPPTRVSTSVTGDDLAALGEGVVAKAINAWQEIGPGRYFNTTLLPPSARRALTDAPRLATPVLLQSHLPHRVEYRCYCAAGRSIVVRLELAPGAVDARLPGSVSRADLTDERSAFAGRLVELTAELGLSYCCYDVIVGADDELWITDVNPIGSWAYLRAEHGLDLTTSLLADWLRNEG